MKPGRYVIVMGTANPVVIGGFESRTAAQNYEVTIDDVRPRYITMMLTTRQMNAAKRAAGRLKQARARSKS